MSIETWIVHHVVGCFFSALSFWMGRRLILIYEITLKTGYAPKSFSKPENYVDHPIPKPVSCYGIFCGAIGIFFSFAIACYLLTIDLMLIIGWLVETF